MSRAKTPTNLNNVNAKPSDARLEAAWGKAIAARTNANTSASAFNKEQNNQGLKRTVSSMLGPSNNFVDMCGDGDESDCTFRDSGPQKHLRKPSSQYRSKWWQYYLEFNLFKYPDKNGIAVCKCGSDANGGGGYGVAISATKGISGLQRHI